MTANPILRTTGLLSPSQAVRAIATPAVLDTEPTGDTADLGPFRSKVNRLLGDGQTLSAKTDARLAKVLHECLAGVRRRTLLDARTWQWMSISQLSDYCLARWTDGLDTERSDELTDSQLGRFLGSASLNGRSRNALARLYWGAQLAFEATGAYDEVETVFANADLIVGVTERKIGLSPTASIAVMNRLKVENEKKRRKALRRLNHVLSTTSLESLDADEVVELLGLS